MIINAITYILQMLTAFYYNIENYWDIARIVDTENQVIYTIKMSDILIWYLCVAIIFSLLIRLLGGIATTWKETMK